MLPDDLEREVLPALPFDLLKAALVASGAKTQALASYSEKASILLARFLREADIADRSVSRAKALFDWLWQRKPGRYRPGASFRLDSVLDAETDPAQPVVGNCLGLTLLYNVMARSLGLQIAAVHLEQAFGRGPHVLSLLIEGDRSLDIENRLSNGFDYKGHQGLPDRQVWEDLGLVADVYFSQGNLHFNAGGFDLALAEHDKALALNPAYQAARLGKGMALAALGREDEAERTLGWP